MTPQRIRGPPGRFEWEREPGGTWPLSQAEAVLYNVLADIRDELKQIHQNLPVVYELRPIRASLDRIDKRLKQGGAKLGNGGRRKKA